ncbi:MAG: hypothetical protein CMC82_04365 [Flavobacteriaceae bacterium]|nr:hypothetical protein [Flavobacteriaceae bacterium]|tara:strand:+ start:3157 stop:4002 length:846 start_codon:yes stop_codon:yes gene_type:complete
MRILFVFLFLSTLIGCQSPNNSNNEESIVKTVEKYTLPDILEETSGLALINDTLWTLNDSGNEAALYAISNKGALLDKKDTTKTNIDWEDMTVVNGNMLVADMGNNFGTRKNLYLLEIDLSNGGATTLDSIPFHYPEQDNFDFQQDTHFDAEGIVIAENKIVVFTKNRSMLTSEVYVISPSGGPATKMGSLAVGSLITGADYQQENKTLVLTGYRRDDNQYLYVIDNFSLSAIADANISQYELNFNGAQIEAISIIDAKTFWITSEKTTTFNAFLAKIRVQ